MRAGGAEGRLCEAELELKAGSPECLLETDDGIAIANALKDAGLVSSTSEGFRMIKQGAVRVDGEKVEDRSLSLPVGASHVIQVGKRRIARVCVRKQ